MTAGHAAELDERVEVGPWRFALWRPRDVESLLDEEAFARAEFLPYWAELWPSGVALARHVAGLGLHGARVLELGCGLGLPSLAAAAAGAEVTATDWAEEALVLVRRNAARNDLRLHAALLEWDGPATLPAGPFDLVLAADVLYEARNAAPLLALLDQTVGSGGKALLADPGRRHAPAFFDSARAVWRVDQQPSETLPSGAIYRLERI